MRKQATLLSVIDDREVEDIHRTSLRILDELGVRFPNHRMLDRLEAVGARVDRDTMIARFPPQVVERAVDELPKDFSLSPADGGPPVRLGDGTLKLSMDQTPDIVDYATNTKARHPKAEILRGIAVANALPHVRLATGYCLPNDVPAAAGDVVSFELLWTYSQKAVASWIYSAPAAETILEMATVVCGSAEELKKQRILTYFAEPVSPLRWAEHSLEIVLLLSQYECPIYLGPMVTAGGSGPITLAGTLALHNAEILQGLVMVHACSPRQPVIYSCHAHRLDMRRGTILYGSPEQALLAAAATQLARRYGFAISGNVMLHDSNCPDYMAGFEAGSTAAYALAAGWDMLGFIGFGTLGVVGSGVGHSLEQAIVQDEALGYLERLLQSFEVTDETLAYDVIREVGVGGSFLSQPHTVAHLRSELWQDGGIFRSIDYDTWASSGAETTFSRAHGKLREILASSLPLQPLIDPAKQRELERLSRLYVESCERSAT